jgi:hypothetical protein
LVSIETVVFLLVAAVEDNCHTGHSGAADRNILVAVLVVVVARSTTFLLLLEFLAVGDPGGLFAAVVLPVWDG